jgi:hypothetical protein
MAGLYDSRIAEAQQKQRMAELLRNQYQNQPAGQMVSGWYVPNYGNAIMGAMSNILGAYQEKEAKDELKGIEREKNQALVDALGQAGITAPSHLLKQAGTEEVKPGWIDRASAFLRGEEAKGTPAQPYQQNVAQNVSPAQYNQALTNMMGISPEYASNILSLEKLKAEQAKEARKERMENVPTGFTAGANGEIIPMPIAGGGNYADFRLKEAAAKEGIISPVERQNMAMQQANFGLAQKNFERNLQKDVQEQARLQEGKDVPANQLSSQAENFNAINQIDKAIQAVDNNPNAFGTKNYLPGAVTQRLDPKGVDARARVAEIGAVKLHDLSGATVNASEAPRFQPFLPSATDDPQKIKENLLKMRESMIGLEQERNNMYSDGWKKQLKPLDRFKQPEQPAQGGFTIRPLGQ